MNDSNIIADALVDVRKAHRLIYTYNRRIFEMIQSINGNLPGFTFERIDPAYENEFKNWSPNKNDLSFWETIPAIQLISFWSKQAEPGIVSKGDLLFCVVFTVDTEWENDEDDADPSTYSKSATESNTKLTFYLLSMQREMTKTKMLNTWYDFDDGDDMKLTKGNGGKTLGITKTINMVTINSESDLLDQTNMFMSVASTLIK